MLFFHGLINRLDISEESVSENENRSRETSQNVKMNLTKKDQKQSRTYKNCETIFKRCKFYVCITRMLKEKKGREEILK